MTPYDLSAAEEREASCHWACVNYERLNLAVAQIL
jgi:hypothetical protein